MPWTGDRCGSSRCYCVPVHPPDAPHPGRRRRTSGRTVPAGCGETPCSALPSPPRTAFHLRPDELPGQPVSFFRQKYLPVDDAALFGVFQQLVAQRCNNQFGVSLRFHPPHVPADVPAEYGISCPQTVADSPPALFVVALVYHAESLWR